MKAARIVCASWRMVASAIALVAAAAATLSLGGCFGSDVAAQMPPPVVVNELAPVVAVAHTAEAVPVAGSDGKFHLVYELRLMNARAARLSAAATERQLTWNCSCSFLNSSPTR